MNPTPPMPPVHAELWAVHGPAIEAATAAADAAANAVRRTLKVYGGVK